MKNMNEIRRNIRAVEETRQITNAMFLLSTSRIKKAMMEIGHNSRYMRRVRETIKDILIKSPNVQNRYVEEAYIKHSRAAFLVVASDKGLCGSYNASVVNTAIEEIKKHKNAYVTTCGMMATQMLEANDIKVDHEWFGVSQNPSMYFARKIGEKFVELFKSHRIKELYVIYSHYNNQMSQEPVCVRLVPLSLEDFADVKLNVDPNVEIVYEPSIEQVFDTMGPQYIIGFIYGCLHHAVASEHTARMNAMQNATNNADEMIKKLNKEFNSARQLSITNEISEIAAATSVIQEKSI